MHNDDYMAYHAGLQSEALIRLYDVLLVIATQLAGDDSIAHNLLQHHAEGKYYFAPPTFDTGVPQGDAGAPHDAASNPQ